MPELAFQDSRSGFRARDLSPDSVIFNGGESNFSLFSSTSGSVERCSFASDFVPEQVYLASAVSQHLTGHGLPHVLNGPDPDPDKSTLAHKNNVNTIRKEKAKVQKLDSSEAETTEDENLVGDSARNSFSRAIKECQDRRLKSEIRLKKAHRPRTASLDLNNAVINASNSSSPRFGTIMKKPYVAPLRTGTFPSPGTPNYKHTSVGVHKGWSSERVPQHTSSNRRNESSAMLPYNINGRTLPSKWEDAERWICSPVSGDNAMKGSIQQPKGRPKSKSGPLGPPGLAYNQMFSPATPMFDERHNGKAIVASAFSTGVMVVDSLSARYGACESSSRNFLATTEPCMGRSVSIHGYSEMMHQSMMPGLQAYTDERYDDSDNTPNNISRDVSRRDMATQMSPLSSIQSSPRRRSSSSFSLAPPPLIPLVQLHNMTSSKSEIRDVPIDEHVSVTKWCKKNKSKSSSRGSGNADDWKKRAAVSIRSTRWEVSTDNASKNISKIQREEAKIMAWENLQKAKAEAAISKLEMKLEKRRSSSMDKIMNKLKSAQKKAQKMRTSTITNQTHNAGRSSDKTLSFRRPRQLSSLSGCFTCRVF